MSTPVPVESLHQSELLAACSREQLTDLIRRSSEMRLASGELLFSEDDQAQAVWVVLEGELVLTKLVDGDEVIIDRLGPGAYLGEISLLTGTRAQHRARAKGAVRLLRIPDDVFRALIVSCQAVMETVLRTLAERMGRIEHLLQQRERMASLGTLAAGLAHELNNPASAARRATDLLTEHFAALEPLARRLAKHAWTEEEVRLLAQLELATSSAAEAQSIRELDALTRSDREEALGNWLGEQGIDRGWELAPLLVDRGVTVAQLSSMMRGCDARAVNDAIAWTEKMTAIRQLIDEVGKSTGRIADIVRAVKAYSYVDTTTPRSVDVHDSLENSLTILGHKLRDARATVAREYDRRVPQVASFGTELNQVWTNLLDNAADAMSPGGGTIRVRTLCRDGRVVVEISDSGPGIAEEHRSKIFDPFFTTKGAGKGTGLGLEIVKRIVVKHSGTIDVVSNPGDTRFTVTLPAAQPSAAPSSDRAASERGDPGVPAATSQDPPSTRSVS